MDKKFCFRQMLLATTFLVFALVLFETSGLDLWLQKIMYQSGSGQWTLDKQNEVLRYWFYDEPKKVLGGVLMFMALALALSGQFERLKPYRRGLAIVLVSTAVTVLLVGYLKALTNVPCPKDLGFFGGDYPYITLLHRAESVGSLDRVRCFPAGHASGGFALLSLFFLFRRSRNQWLGLGIGMTVGWVLGIYKMLIGDHFLSHTVTTMLLAWLVSVSVACCVYCLAPERGHEPAR
ncbi:phosphatase PAP2 family protein [Microbulbifer aggregans]|uniref:phosphatase PAP2 family protein n=1 Tax=Microbulbifer aggregans TaxID=1769779 RepID=UPI001CFD1CCF|nr:phosphatase PAP2 family protein [Microbulbifer aggregans]